MSDISKAAAGIAAKATGLRPDQIERAIIAYRSAVDEISPDVEPDWQTQSHICGGEEAFHVYVAEGTEVSLTVQMWKSRNEWKSERVYAFRNKPFESYAEARAAEMEATARPRPYAVEAPTETTHRNEKGLAGES